MLHKRPALMRVCVSKKLGTSWVFNFTRLRSVKLWRYSAHFIYFPLFAFPILYEPFEHSRTKRIHETNLLNRIQIGKSKTQDLYGFGLVYSMSIYNLDSAGMARLKNCIESWKSWHVQTGSRCQESQSHLVIVHRDSSFTLLSHYLGLLKD